MCEKKKNYLIANICLLLVSYTPSNRQEDYPSNKNPVHQQHGCGKKDRENQIHIHRGCLRIPNPFSSRVSLDNSGEGRSVEIEVLTGSGGMSLNGTYLSTCNCLQLDCSFWLCNSNVPTTGTRTLTKLKNLVAELA